MRWTEERLAILPSNNGFRLRGLEMTRLETFTDAAFAFATTMLVISLSGIPNTVAELISALKDTPAFLASFAAIAAFWNGHRRWSRRYGLEDGLATLISLGLVFVMLVFVYPLKMVFSALFAWFTGGGLPTGFALESSADLPRLFVVYGIGFFALTGLIGLLYVHAYRTSGRLALNDLERLKTRAEIASYAVLSATGLASCLWAALLPLRWGVWAGFGYASLMISLPLVSLGFRRAARRLAA